MSCEKFDPKCASCRPCLLSPFTGKPIPDSDPAVAAMNRAWDSAPYEEQEAFWLCTVKSSKDPAKLALVQRLMLKVKSMAAN